MFPQVIVGAQIIIITSIIFSMICFHYLPYHNSVNLIRNVNLFWIGIEGWPSKLLGDFFFKYTTTNYTPYPHFILVTLSLVHPKPVPTPGFMPLCHSHRELFRRNTLCFQNLRRGQNPQHSSIMFSTFCFLYLPYHKSLNK
jgi:hypothetical protein